MNDRELRHNLSYVIREAVRTEAGIPEGEHFPSKAFDAAAAAVVSYLAKRRWLYRARGWVTLAAVLLIAGIIRLRTGKWPL